MRPPVTVGFDGSSAARRAVGWAATEATLRQARVHVLACLGAPATLNPWYAVVPVNIDAIRTDIEQCLDAIAAEERARHTGVEIEAEVVLGAPRSELVARAGGSDLLVLGASGAGAVESLVLGSVGRAVTVAARCPVVLVPDIEVPSPRGRIAVGVDAHPAADAALDWAIDEADRRDAELVLVHAWQYQYATEIGSAEGRDMTRVDAALMLDRALERARRRTNRPVNGVLVDDLAADAIVHLGSVADLLVVGSRGRGLFRSAVLGSVAHDVAARSPVPVVVVKPPAA